MVVKRKLAHQLLRSLEAKEPSITGRQDDIEGWAGIQRWAWWHCRQLDISKGPASTRKMRLSTF